MAKIVANLKSHLIDETAKREQIGNELLTIQGNLEAATTQRVSTEQSFITLKQNLNEVIAQRDEAGCIIAHL